LISIKKLSLRPRSGGKERKRRTNVEFVIIPKEQLESTIVRVLDIEWRSTQNLTVL